MRPHTDAPAVGGCDLATALASSRVVSLAQPMRTGMPQSPNHPPFRMLLERRHGDHVRTDGSSASNEIIITGGHVGTHVDALAHFSQNGRLYGGQAATDLQSQDGFAHLGIDEFAPFAGRAVLLDVARLHRVDVLPAGYEITPADLDRALSDAKTTIEPGDAVLVGTGWSRRWAEREAFIGKRDGVPGPGDSAGRWLAEHRPRVVGGETIAFEHIPAGAGHARLPVHRTMLADNGINIIETMFLVPLLDEWVTDFALVVNPLPVVGATGAPVCPLALLRT